MLSPLAAASWFHRSDVLRAVFAAASAAANVATCVCTVRSPLSLAAAVV